MSNQPLSFATLKHADNRKRQLIEFATVGPLKEDFEHQRQLFYELAEPGGEHEEQSLLEWFLYDWVDDYGEGVIDHFVDSHDDLSEADETMLLEWMASVNSVFEIKAVKKGQISLHDLDSEEVFSVALLSEITDLPFKKGQFIAARLLPLGDTFIFAGAQYLMPDRKAALEVLAMRQSLEDWESSEELLQVQQEQRQAFIELFGSDEVSMDAKQIPSMIGRFQRYILLERKDAETGKTAAELYQEECGDEMSLPEIPPLPQELAEAGEVTILCDEFDGIVILPDYQKFKQVFASLDVDAEIPDWQDLLWDYIEDPSIPIVAFERVAETHPEQVEKMMRLLLEDETFSIEHLYAALLHYKQPVDGIEDMEDEELLWDLFDSGEATKADTIEPNTNGKPLSNVIDFSSKSSSAKKP
ncbi:MAG: hypothetical protein HY231_15445 [Acidobacteria bacterium]|nr:hypothetical protein [Acidobacteriota bacterium]